MVPQNPVCFFRGVGYKTIGLGNRYGFSQERKGVGASIGMLALDLTVIDTVGAQTGWGSRFQTPHRKPLGIKPIGQGHTAGRAHAPRRKRYFSPMNHPPQKGPRGHHHAATDIELPIHSDPVNFLIVYGKRRGFSLNNRQTRRFRNMLLNRGPKQSPIRLGSGPPNGRPLAAV